jgi:hypothetical protein
VKIEKISTCPRIQLHVCNLAMQSRLKKPPKFPYNPYLLPLIKSHDSLGRNFSGEEAYFWRENSSNRRSRSSRYIKKQNMHRALVSWFGLLLRFVTWKLVESVVVLFVVPVCVKIDPIWLGLNDIEHAKRHIQVGNIIPS